MIEQYITIILPIMLTVLLQGCWANNPVNNQCYINKISIYEV